MESETTYALVRTWATVGGLIFMVAAFLGILAYALWPSNKKVFDHMASLPLEDEPLDARQGDSGKSGNPDQEKTETGR
ncbi:MAG: CcoQ/FixQ family Cbb3-type cytochrome c oxidase assembly chaperone [Alphaproteobacteria bacterium HGW-Alphaproteobacteria-12]|nr:MAG: CcoQ/FixQ family Cbb3-type cytochrome c oxidase assembly chaperone [Alphaproteobacteria bacterium HGW-Alphaproteobacteria-12]